jgi:hypothetical protein
MYEKVNLPQKHYSKTMNRIYKTYRKNFGFSNHKQLENID